VKITGGKRRPGSPVGVGGLIAAFIKIGPPGLSFDVFNRPGIFFEHCQGKRKLQPPDNRFSDLGFDNGRETGISPDLLIIVRRERDVFFETAPHTGRIRHIRGGKSTTAIKLKIKVPGALFRLYKKFHTAVFPDIALKTGLD
jgi:hypothetical protein